MPERHETGPGSPGSRAESPETRERGSRAESPETRERGSRAESPETRSQGSRAESPGPREPGSRQPRQRATALSYDPAQSAPRVVATGAGVIAERIVAAARDAGVPVRSDPALVQALAALDLGSEIPETLYVAVAEALAWAYRLDAQARREGLRRPH